MTGTASQSPPLRKDLEQEFDARPMGRLEKRYLQAALAITEDYSGMIDGEWGTGSQAALEAYVRREFEDGVPLNIHAAALAIFSAETFASQEWEPYWFDNFATALYLPSNGLELKEDQGSEFLHLYSEPLTLDLYMSVHPAETARGIHQTAYELHDGSEEPYIIRQDHLWVTSVVNNQVRDYVRTDPHPSGGFRTIAFNYGEWAAGNELVLASLSDRRLPQLDFPASTQLGRLMEELFVAMEANEGPPAAVPEDEEPLPPASLLSGSGFYVTDDGHVLTNAHVIRTCNTVRADGRPATIVTSSDDFDLALLRLDGGTSFGKPLPFAARPAGLNADITIAGYPLAGILSGLNVTRGTVSGLSGLESDVTRVQITAPVQSGNSGGPMVDRTGAVVGVVVSKLDAGVIADETGDLPQNVNFAVRGQAAQAALATWGVEYSISTSSDALSPEEIGRRLRESAVRIECE